MIVPYGMIMEQAKNEIKTLVQSIMDKNKISPDMMSYIIDSVSNEVKDMKSSYYSNEYIKAMSASDGDKEA